MNRTHRSFALIASLLTIGSAQAVAGGWHYDEDSDTRKHQYRFLLPGFRDNQQYQGDDQ